MSIFSSLKEVLAKYVWPWIKEHVLPAIQAYLVTAIPELIDWSMQKIKDIFRENSKQREKEAMDNAREAESKAEKSNSELEIAELKKEAEIWKKVAQQYKDDLDAIKLKVDVIEKETTAEVKEEIMKVDPEISFESSGINLTIGDSRISLPSLEK